MKSSFMLSGGVWRRCERSTDFECKVGLLLWYEELCVIILSLDDFKVMNIYPTQNKHSNIITTSGEQPVVPAFAWDNPDCSLHVARGSGSISQVRNVMFRVWMLSLAAVWHFTVSASQERRCHCAPVCSACSVSAWLCVENRRPAQLPCCFTSSSQFPERM